MLFNYNLIMDKPVSVYISCKQMPHFSQEKAFSLGIQVHCPTLSTCEIMRDKKCEPWDMTVYICKVIVGLSRDKPDRMCALACHLLASEQQHSFWKQFGV